MVSDATVFCCTGLEFLCRDYADEDYPEVWGDIEAASRFETCWEGERQFCHLMDAELELR